MAPPPSLGVLLYVFLSWLVGWFVETAKLSLRSHRQPMGTKNLRLQQQGQPLCRLTVTHGSQAAPGYLLMLTNTAVFFICWKKSLLQSPLVAGVKEQATMMKSDSAASWGVVTGGGKG